MAPPSARPEDRAETTTWLAAIAMLLTVRELAARVTIEALQRQRVPSFASFDANLSDRFREFMLLPALPDRVRHFMGWLRLPDKSGLDERQRLPAGFDATAEACLAQGWQQVCGWSGFSRDDELLANGLVSEGIAPPISRLHMAGMPPLSKENQPSWRWPLKPLSPHTVMPVKEAAQFGSYAEVWRGLMEGGYRLPAEWPDDRDGLTRWLDRFDSLLASTLHAVPARCDRPGAMDSLYRQARLAAAAAVAAWHVQQSAKARSSPSAQTFLLVQAEFTPIQDFIFGTDPRTPWSSDAVLGSRSSHVRLVMELASVAILEAMALPPTSLLLAAASKCLFLAPNTPEARKSVLPRLQRELADWSRANYYGRAGIQLAWIPVGAEAVSWSGSTGRARESIAVTFRRLHETAEEEKHKRWRLAEPGRSPVIEHYLPALDRWLGTCTLDAHAPASSSVQAPWELIDPTRRKQAAPPLSRQGATQLWHYLQLARPGTVRIVRDQERRRDAPASDRLHMLGMELRIDPKAAIAPPSTLREWDIGHGPAGDRDVFNGEAQRGLAQRRRPPRQGQAEQAKAVLCGDIDRLGQAFQRGIPNPSMARTIELSRQIDQFFTLVVPSWLQRHAPTIDTALAGGDDFMFVGPLPDMLRLPGALWRLFRDYACHEVISFSAGLAVSRGDTPMKTVTDLADEHLAQAKMTRGAICAHGHVMPWEQWLALEKLEQMLREAVVGQRSESVARLWRWLADLVRTLPLQDEHLGHRWRTRLHSWLASWCRQEKGRNGKVIDQSRLFDLLSHAIETHGVLFEVIVLHLLLERT